MLKYNRFYAKFYLGSVDLIEKLKKTIINYSMFEKNDLIIVGLSGGPDSLALLHVLYQLKDSLQINLVAAHINHCLRGEDSEEDERFVRVFCENHNIPLYVKKIDIEEVSKHLGISSEMAGREVRYQYFEQLLEELSANKIALAHHANDQAETILMRLIRGCGLEGIIGIKPVREERYVRPMIHLLRTEIENYCLTNNLNPRIDKSNYENIYSRNKIRLELIPYIKENFNHDIVNTLNRFSETVKIDNDYLELCAEKKFKDYFSVEYNNGVICEKAFQEHPAILNRIIRMAIKSIKGDLTNVEKKHIEGIISLQKNSTGKELNLPDGIKIFNNYKDVCIKQYIDESDIISYPNEEYKLLIEGITKIEKENFNISLKILKNDDARKINKNNKFIKYFDYDLINNDIILRYRKNGDRFSPLGMKGSKKIKDYFMDLKIPKNKRDEVPMICFDKEIAWIVGYGISEKFKVNDKTKDILQIKIESEEK
ncbi:tRNA(Ile)-lysidine synthase [Clostridium grantii DSM 8605]|uniref:tRNA(Ile)-lysidine synthase n=1 Tax=Clostridium grantii DSM 8605 TaxID=1121316 RepID=A0A1M5XZP6_9CLOT|nr:tRNA(Ile)-lysidine synthase [Clostridium grantii DSM 8605]